MSRYSHVYPFVARNHGGIPFSGVCPQRTVSYEEILPKLLLPKNLLRKINLKYSQPRKCLAEKIPGVERKFLDHYIIELKSVQDEAYLPSTG